MNAERLIAHFDRISEAPDAIPRLRRFILDLAVRGRLVQQDPAAEPASELLKRIQTEKARLLKAGELRKEKALPQIEKDDAPFSAPAGWAWVPIRQVTSDRGQIIPEKDFTYIDVTAIDKEAGRITDAKVVSASDAPSRARKLVRRGDVLYSCVRPYLLNIAVVNTDLNPPPIASTAFAVLNGFGLVIPRYLWIALRSPVIVERVEAKMRGQAYPAINDADFAMLPLPLPPLAEQQRIVAKVDELMSLCDRLEAAQAERERRLDRVVAASLHCLSELGDASAVRQHAAFFLEHLPRLTTRVEHIQQMRSTILSLAVRGRLVAQDPNDEPASQLLEKIQNEKERLLKDGTIKSLHQTSEIPTGEAPSGIPNTWAWVHVGDLLQGDSQNGYSRKPDDAIDGIPILRISAGTLRKDGIVAEEQHKLISGISQEEQRRYALQPGDLLACRFNGNRTYVGRLSEYVGYLGIKPIYPDKLIRLRLLQPFVLPSLLRWFAESKLIRGVIESYCATTVGNWGISATNLRKVIVPLPPLAEQHRIVSNIEKLMTVCDQLEAQIVATQAERRHLLEAVLHDALAQPA